MLVPYRTFNRYSMRNSNSTTISKILDSNNCFNHCDQNLNVFVYVDREIWESLILWTI